MYRIVWIFVVSYVVLGVGIFYSLVVESSPLFLASAATFVVLAASQWVFVFLSRRGEHLSASGGLPRDGT
ncbi:hypothetical protein [Natronolimnohabitans innermongolicus]|uniref:Uncharacterized protein n=1 Tax=Natronolimnohabitans innermongolicus JCM 12255 TaxID=1227499 RepID=L9XBH3_9EURY|nr:hypothetical protein [Natronolimnohabitans innermongolicus]ELY59084.1 hypothetical protein C493_05520 [Natronolimnohabitans innermongolicus JCM 12255]